MSMRLGQTLHGYRDGHRLLVSSRDLGSADRRILARQTDHPDAGRVRDWTRLMLALPLPSGTTAISMTWPAFEMPRPGCVWTHSIFLERDEVQPADLASLLRCFRRPDPAGLELDGYDEDILVVDRAEEAPFDRREREWYGALVWALYSPPRRFVRVDGIVLSDEERHRVALRVLGTGWPSARSVLSFADGPLTDREIESRPVDLLLSLATHTNGTALSKARVLHGVPDAEFPDWVGDLTSEGAGTTNGWRRFVGCYGEAFYDEIEVLPVLAAVYGGHRPGTDRDALGVVETLANAFPLSTQASQLKRDVLNPTGPPAGCAAPLAESRLLSALIRTENLQAFDPTALDLAGRVRRFASTDPVGFADLLDSVGASSANEDLVLGVLVEQLDASQLSDLAQRNAGLGLGLARHLPSLAHSPALWQTLDPSKLWEAVARQRRRDDRLATVLAAIRGGVAPDAQVVGKRWKNRSSVILDAIALADMEESRLDGWAALVAPEAMPDWLNEADHRVGPAVLRRLATQLYPQASERLSWEVQQRLIPEALPIDSVAHLFTIALKRLDEPAVADVAVSAFSRLARSARDQGLADEVVSLLELPQSGVPEWDLIARMARRLNVALKAQRWSPTAALNIGDRDDFASVIEADKHAGLARRILSEAAIHRIPITEWQQDLLTGIVSQKAERDSLAAVFEDLARALWPF